MSTQLTLSVDLPDTADFSNFIAGENEDVIKALKYFLNDDDNIFYLWGEEGVGVTHLLMAVCQLVINAAYISFSQYKSLSPAVLEGIENIPVICLDDVDCIVENQEWEQALFHCYNRVVSQGNKIIVASHDSPSQIKIQLPDLKSRLLAGPVYQVKPLDDENKMLALKTRAALHGWEMSDEVVRYLFNHAERNLKSLFVILSRLEKETLTQHRRLTVPFLKELLDC